MAVAAAREAIPNVYVSLEELARLKHAGQSFTFLPRQPVTSQLSGRRASKLRGRGLAFEEMRLYHVGDDTRTIDWKATARTQKPHVRVYTEERERPALMLVDQRQSMFFGSKRCLKSVTAARAAAMSAWRVVSVSDRIGAVIFNDTDILELKPRRSNAHVMRILGAIRDLNHALSADSDVATDPGALNRALERAHRFVTHDYLVAIISDFTGADEKTRRLVTELRQHNDVLAIPVWDPLEAALPDIGRAVVTDGALQIDADTSSEDLREKYASLHRDRTAQLENLALHYDIPAIPLWTDRDVPEQVAERLGRVPRTRRG